MRRKYILWMAALWMPSLCIGQQIKVDASKTIDYTQFETFTIVKGDFTTPKAERQITEEKLFEQISNAVIHELESRGYKYVNDSAAQLVVSYVAGAYNVTKSGNVGPFGEVPITNPTMVDQSRYWNEDHKEGMLMLEITQPRSKTPIWSAEGQVNLSNADQRVVETTVVKMLKKFPSRLKKKKKK